MAAGTWTMYRSAKGRMGLSPSTGLPLEAGVWRMALFTTAASASITNQSMSLWSHIGTSNEVAGGGGYTTKGKTLSNSAWTLSGNNWVFRWTSSGIRWSGSLGNVRYALIYQSASNGGGPVVCYAALSTAQFIVNTGNTLTVKPAAAGVFTLA